MRLLIRDRGRKSARDFNAMFPRESMDSDGHPRERGRHTQSASARSARSGKKAGLAGTDDHDTGGFDYETISGGYYDAVFRRGRGIQSKWHHLKFNRVIQEMDGHRRHLDVGCGPGTLIGLLDHRFVSTGIDISTPEIDYARSAYECESKRFFTGPAHALPDECCDYDVATIVEVIEHLAPADLDDMLRTMIGRLRPGGKLVVTTPNFRSAWPLVEMLVDRFGELDYAPQHINNFTSRRLRQLLQDVGLEDVRVRPYLALAPFAAPLGWRLADAFARVERGPLERAVGLLLLGTGSKPRDQWGRSGLPEGDRHRTRHG